MRSREGFHWKKKKIYIYFCIYIYMQAERSLANLQSFAALYPYFLSCSWWQPRSDQAFHMCCTSLVLSVFQGHCSPKYPFLPCFMNFSLLRDSVALMHTFSRNNQVNQLKRSPSLNCILYFSSQRNIPKVSSTSSISLTPHLLCNSCLFIFQPHRSTAPVKAISNVNTAKGMYFCPHGTQSLQHSANLITYRPWYSFPPRFP